jgi:flagellar biogenesis protein FliO
VLRNEEEFMANQRTMIYAVGAVIVIILLIIFLTN